MFNQMIEFMLRRASTYGSYHPSKDPPQWILSRKFFARSGVNVTPENAKQLAAFYSGIDLYCRTFAALPFVVYKRLDNGGKERATKHWLYRLLHEKPNRFMTPAEFKEMLMGHLLLRGNYYAKKAFNNAGRVAELWPIHPDRVTPSWEKLDGKAYGLVYTITGTKDEGGGRYLSDDILHIKGAGSDGIRGESIIENGRETIGRGLAAGEHASDHFKNFAVPLGVLEYPEELTDAEYDRLKASWKERQGGDNRYSPAILEGGMKWQKLGLTHEEGQFLESRKFEVAEIARLLGLPLHKLGELDRSTHTNIEQQQIQYKEDSVQPWAVRIEEAVSLGLLTDEERKTIFAEFLMEGLLRGDTNARHNAYHIALQDGWMSRNEVRARENLNPEPGLDEFLEPLNMVPAGTERDPADPKQPAAAAPAEEEPEEEPAPKKQKKSVDVEALRPVWDDIAARCLTKERNAVKRCAQKTDAGRRLEEFYSDHAAFLATAFAPLTESVGGCTVARLENWAGSVVIERTARVVEILKTLNYAEQLERFADSLTLSTDLFESLKVQHE